MDEETDILTTPEAAELLRVGVHTIIREARAGRLPGRRIGKEWRFSRTGLLEWLNEGPGEEDLSRYRRLSPEQPESPAAAQPSGSVD